MATFSRFLLLLSVITLSVNTLVRAQPYKDPALSVAARTADLLSRMTPEEKFSQLFMVPGDLSIGRDKLKKGIFGLQDRGNSASADAVQQLIPQDSSRSAYESAITNNGIQRFFREESRLGIPVIIFEEALHGLVLPGSTAFPQAIGLAASFDTSLMHRVAGAIAEECLSRGIRQVLSPVVNLATDVRWGRTEETYGEDPHLSSEMGISFVSEFEKRGIITTPKHFVANTGDGGRDSYPVNLSERALRTTYLVPFEACFKTGGSRAVMSSYNSLDGIPCTAHPWLLRSLLKEEWGFRGFVISDAGGVGGANVLHFTASDYTEATANAMNAGLDVILQTSYDHYPLFYDAFQKGLIPPSRIDDAVSRVLRAKLELGLFEDPYVDPGHAAAVNGSAAHREVALEAARESIVLLKNDHGTLPLKRGIGRIAVIGPDAAEGRLGGYSGPGNKVVSVLEGMRQVAGGNTEIVYSRGCERMIKDLLPVPSSSLFHLENKEMKPGLRGEYFNNINLSGVPVLVRTDPLINFRWTLYGPDPEKLPYGFYSVRWTGKLVPAESGTFRLGVDGNDGYRLWIDGLLLIDRSVQRTRKVTTSSFTFEKGKSYDLKIEYGEPRGNAWFALVWDAGLQNDFGWQMEEAVDLAMNSDAVVIVAGIEEGEFRDRASLDLPGNQEELIRRVSALDKPVIVVLIGGSAVTMENWIDGADAVIDAWYPGEAGGTAVAEVLFGDYSPAGRLPVTFPVSVGQLPLVYNHLPTGRGDDYDDLTGQPAFPFGFGLSYTSFSYGNLKIGKKEIARGESSEVTFTVANTGLFDGDEVVQLYLRETVSPVAIPVIALKWFDRIHLKQGESKTVTARITPAMLSIPGDDGEPLIDPGTYEIMIGSSSRDIRLKGSLSVSAPD